MNNLTPEIYEKYYKLVLKAVNNFMKKKNVFYEEREDYIQEAWIIFSRCLEKYNPSKGAVSTYFYASVNGDLKKFWEKNTFKDKITETYIENDDEEWMNLNKKLFYTNDFYERRAREVKLMNLIKEALTDKEYFFLLLKCGFLGHDQLDYDQMINEHFEELRPRGSESNAKKDIKTRTRHHLTDMTHKIYRKLRPYREAIYKLRKEDV